MHVLFLTSHLPYPPNSGGRLREFKLLNELKDKCKITLCVVSNTFQEDMKNLQYIRDMFVDAQIFRSYDNKLTINKYPEKMIRNFSVEARRYITAITLCKNNIDIIHLEGYYMFSNIANNIKIPVLLVEQNIEYFLVKQEMMLLSNIKYCERNKKEYILNKKYERMAWQRCDLCITLTKEDKLVINKYEKDVNCVLITNGIDNFPSKEEKKQDITKKMNKIDYILYVGNFAYYPNVDAAIYLIDHIFPYIKNKYPEMKLYFVGNESDKILSKYKNDDIFIMGTVDDVSPFYINARLCVFPLRIGGGIKVKVLEALALGRFVVTTPIGAQGIANIENSQLIVGNNTQELIEAVFFVLNMSKEEKLKRKKKTKLILSKFTTWRETAKKFISQYEKLLKKKEKL